jgi:hypothetical protein
MNPELKEIKPLKVTKPDIDFVVEDHELNRFVEDVYGLQDYNVACSEEWSNDTEHRVEARKEELAQYYKDKLKDLSTNSYTLSAIMSDLCNRDLIKPGVYLITVCW